jgi:hypothetical protein
MKTIDKTPFYKDGKLSLIDRGKAIMQYGMGWFKEIEAQNQVIAVLDKNLDKNFTLLRNVVPPGLDATIPFILVGPTGVFIMNVTPLTGMFRAKGDEWGTVTGSTFKPEKPNLLTRTERMARAVQVFLQRQGFSDLTAVEAILLCSDPTVTVDSLRPIIRVIMRDALERFTVSVAQARIVLTPESARKIANRILNPVDPAPAQPEETAETIPNVSTIEHSEDPYVPAFALPGAETAPGSPFFQPEAPGQADETHPVGMQPARKRKGPTRKQWGLLIGMFIFWLLIVVVFTFLIVKNLYF